MATSIDNIITNARDTLADANKQRWTDDRLLRLIDEGQEDINIKNEILKTQFDIQIVVGVHTYPMPDDSYRILRASTESYLSIVAMDGFAYKILP